MAELEMAEPPLSSASIAGVYVKPLVTVTGNPNVRATGYVFEEPPEGRSGSYNALELAQHFQTVTGGRTAPRAGEVRAG